MNARIFVQNNGTVPLPNYKGEKGETSIVLLPLRCEDLLALEQLDPHHRDPFDRLLIAQAIANSLTLLTGDVAIKRYPVRAAW